jgi:hypothetical protein
MKEGSKYTSRISKLFSVYLLADACSKYLSNKGPYFLVSLEDCSNGYPFGPHCEMGFEDLLWALE